MAAVLFFGELQITFLYHLSAQKQFWCQSSQIAEQEGEGHICQHIDKGIYKKSLFNQGEGIKAKGRKGSKTA